MESNRFSMSRRNFVQLSGAAGILSVAGLAGCGSGGSGSSDGGSSDGSAKFKIGGIGPVSGEAAIYGKAVQTGMEVAVDELASKGGKVQFETKFEDDEADGEKSVNAYNTLKDWGMQILCGSVTTDACVATSAKSNEDNLFQFTPSASSTDVIGGQPDANGNVSQQRKKNVFQMCFTDPNQGTASAKYIKEKALGTKVGVIYNSATAYSAGIYQKFVAEAKNEGLEVVSEQAFTDDKNQDFTPQLQACKDADADLVFLPDYYTPISLILKQAKDMGFAPKWFGCDGVDGLLTVEGFDKSLAEGVMLLTPFSADATDDLTKSFVAAYKEKAGDVPNQFAADAYDVVMATAQALEKAGVTADMSVSDICDKLVETITSSDFTYSGLTGQNMTWKDTGEVSKDPKGMVIKDGTYAGMDN